MTLWKTGALAGALFVAAAGWRRVGADRPGQGRRAAEVGKHGSDTCRSGARRRAVGQIGVSVRDVDDSATGSAKTGVLRGRRERGEPGGEGRDQERRRNRRARWRARPQRATVHPSRAGRARWQEGASGCGTGWTACHADRGAGARVRLAVRRRLRVGHAARAAVSTCSTQGADSTQAAAAAFSTASGEFGLAIGRVVAGSVSPSKICPTGSASTSA